MVMLAGSCFTALVLSINIIYTEYDQVVHRSNVTNSSNMTTAYCLEVSRSKMDAARMNIATVITLNTLAIGIAILISCRAISSVGRCITWPDSCKIACNYILILLYLLLVSVSIIILEHVHKSCHKLALALILLLIVVPVTCGPLWCVCAARVPNRNQKFLINGADEL